MDLGLLFLLTLSFGTVFLVIQRAEAKKRRLVIFLMIPVVFVILHYAGSRQVIGEAIVGCVIALVFSFLFWAFVGRYNPVGSSDEIQVLGMDD